MSSRVTHVSIPDTKFTDLPTLGLKERVKMSEKPESDKSVQKKLTGPLGQHFQWIHRQQVDKGPFTHVA